LNVHPTSATTSALRPGSSENRHGFPEAVRDDLRARGRSGDVQREDLPEQDVRVLCVAVRIGGETAVVARIAAVADAPVQPPVRAEEQLAAVVIRTVGVRDADENPCRVGDGSPAGAAVLGDDDSTRPVRVAHVEERIRREVGVECDESSPCSPPVLT
jgi:hypothetical protein